MAASAPKNRVAKKTTMKKRIPTESKELFISLGNLSSQATVKLAKVEIRVWNRYRQNKCNTTSKLN
jgi:hypothetical protein